jgi:hypothetical protein
MLKCGIDAANPLDERFAASNGSVEALENPQTTQLAGREVSLQTTWVQNTGLIFNIIRSGV